jgi:GTP cyclohydrolase I
MDKERIEHAVREILEAIGEDPQREGLVDTPKRVARMYEEIFCGLQEDAKKHLIASLSSWEKEIVLTGCSFSKTS